jgi:hypothetical protein
MGESTVAPSALEQRPGTMRLDEWVAARGPLSPAAAIVVALGACARASRLNRAQLGGVIRSLTTTGIARSQQGDWSWVPTRGGPSARAASDTDVIERIGAILFQCLTGQEPVFPFPVEQDLRARLRNLRPELLGSVVDLTVRALSSRSGPSMTLAAFGRDLRQALGIERHTSGRRRRRRLGLVAAGALVLIAASSWALVTRAERRVQSHGLTQNETAGIDIGSEAANTFALIDEHTAAIKLYQEIGDLLRSRLSPEDPRVAWTEVSEAWVRTLAGDRLTAEQLLRDKPAWLSEQLGDGHPYTRAVRLALAATLEARGATDEAASLRHQAELGTRTLFERAGSVPDLLDSVPAPPGVLAHVAPNAPEREGFRRGPDGQFVVPLTSMQRVTAGRDGWRLHLVVSGACRTSLALGDDPRLVAVTTSRTPDRGWQIQLSGTRSPILLRSHDAPALGVSVFGDKAGALQVKLSDGSASEGRIGAPSPPPNPPYALTFDDPDGTACRVIWLEIPFPYHPGL